MISYNRLMGQKGRRKGKGFRNVRLRETYDFVERWPGVSRHETSKSMGPLIVAWEQMGLSAEGLFTHLMDAARGRFRYESELREIAEQRLIGNRSRRKDTATIARMGPLVELMKRSEATVPGGAGADLGKAVQTWGRQYIDDQLTRHAKTLTRGRPGEPWLYQPVIHLAEQILGAGQSLNRALDLLYDGFRVVGMGDVVTREKIRHILRAERRRWPGFGRGAIEPCKVCVSRRGLGEALEKVRDVQEKVGPAGMERLVRTPAIRRILKRQKEKMKMLEKRLQKKLRLQKPRKVSVKRIRARLLAKSPPHLV